MKELSARNGGGDAQNGKELKRVGLSDVGNYCIGASLPVASCFQVLALVDELRNEVGAVMRDSSRTQTEMRRYVFVNIFCSGKLSIRWKCHVTRLWFVLCFCSNQSRQLSTRQLIHVLRFPLSALSALQGKVDGVLEKLASEPSEAVQAGVGYVGLFLILAVQTGIILFGGNLPQFFGKKKRDHLL